MPSNDDKVLMALLGGFMSGYGIALVNSKRTIDQFEYIGAGVPFLWNKSDNQIQFICCPHEPMYLNSTLRETLVKKSAEYHKYSKGLQELLADEENATEANYNFFMHNRPYDTKQWDATDAKEGVYVAVWTGLTPMIRDDEENSLDLFRVWPIEHALPSYDSNRPYRRGTTGFGKMPPFPLRKEKIEGLRQNPKDWQVTRKYESADSRSHPPFLWSYTRNA